MGGPRDIMPSEVSQTEKGKYCTVSLTCGIQKTKQMNKYNTTETESQIQKQKGA